MRKTVALLTVLAGCCACRSSGTNQKVIAIIPKGTAALFWQSIHSGAMAAGRDFHVTVLWNGPALETDFSRQIQIVDSMIARHVDGIGVSASDHTALNGVIERATRVGIPVTVFDSGVSTTEYMTFLATNNSEAGEMAARKLAELVQGKGKVAMLRHVPGSVSTGDRETRFEEVMAKDFPQIRIVARQFGMAEPAKAQAAAENFLSAHPDLDGIFASGEASTLGAAQALKGRRLGGKVRLVGFDFGDELLADLRTGIISALIVQDPFRIGYDTVKTLVDKLNGRSSPKRIDLTARVIIAADLDKPEIKALLFPDLRHLN
jgi:ribose transport system substrate-binding protein